MSKYGPPLKMSPAHAELIRLLLPAAIKATIRAFGHRDTRSEKPHG